jgi:hypothetical protein
MIAQQLTNRAVAAKNRTMQEHASRQGRSARSPRWAMGVLVGGALALGGCISVTAPDKPIVIELDINIKQEVVYRLAADAGNTIEEHGDLF